MSESHNNNPETGWTSHNGGLHTHPVFGEIVERTANGLSEWECHPASLPEAGKPPYIAKTNLEAIQWTAAVTTKAKTTPPSPTEIQFLKRILPGNSMLVNGEPGPRILDLIKRGYCYVSPIRSGPLLVYTGEQAILLTEAGLHFLLNHMRDEQLAAKAVEEAAQEAIALQEEKPSVSEQLISEFHGTHPMNVAEAVATWVHTPDCSPSARKLIREASLVDGSTRENPEATRSFKCPTCCDAGRITATAGGTRDWITCPNEGHQQKPTQ